MFFVFLSEKKGRPRPLKSTEGPREPMVGSVANTREKYRTPKSTNFTISQKMAGCSVDFQVRRRNNRSDFDDLKMRGSLVCKITEKLDSFLHFTKNGQTLAAAQPRV